MSNQKRFCLARTIAVAITMMAAVGAALPGTTANAQTPTALAPPVSGTVTPANADSSASTTTTTNVAADSVFQWQDVPVDRQVPITRAVFDQGGYQLTDDQGETIVVPFANQNLYVMRFGQTTGSMYFVHDGNTPTLYIPRNGYLENSAAQGARWYPFPQSYTYTAPVYVGPAPSWSDWVGMGWYPDTVFYGGYYSSRPWSVGVSFSPFPGLFFSIGGHSYNGWDAYHAYYTSRAADRIFVRDEPRFGGYSAARRGESYFASHPSTSPRTFRGGLSGRSFGGGRDRRSDSGLGNGDRPSRDDRGGERSGDRGFGGGEGHGGGGRDGGGHR